VKNWGLGIDFGLRIGDWGFDCGVKDWGLKRTWNRQEWLGFFEAVMRCRPTETIPSRLDDFKSVSIPNISIPNQIRNPQSAIRNQSPFPNPQSPISDCTGAFEKAAR
jgi:hypothetical protein